MRCSIKVMIINLFLSGLFNKAIYFLILLMKGRIVTKRNLTPEIPFTKSFSVSNDNRIKKYSQSFIELMEKAMIQIKNK